MPANITDIKRRHLERRVTERRVVLRSEGIREALSRLADAIVVDLNTAGKGAAELLLVGIHTGGVHLATRLGALLRDRLGASPELGTLDITLYRDDVWMGLPQPVVGATNLPADVTGRRVVLVDDVLYTGRTVRAALDAIMDFGRPECVRLVVLCDRGHRELPIRGDYVGATCQTARDETVRVQLVETGGDDRVVVYGRAQ